VLCSGLGALYAPGDETFLFSNGGLVLMISLFEWRACVDDRRRGNSMNVQGHAHLQSLLSYFEFFSFFIDDPYGHN